MLELLQKENLIKAICTGRIRITNDNDGSICMNVYSNEVYFEEYDIIMSPEEYLKRTNVSKIADLLIETFNLEPFMSDREPTRTLNTLNERFVKDLPVMNFLWEYMKNN